MVHISGITVEGIELALERVNNVFDGNIRFKRFDKDGFKYIVTLAVNNSKGLGSRRGLEGQHINAACWHVYGLFFDELFLLNPSATITQCGYKVTPENNWQDKDIGSIVKPLKYSKACDCEKDKELHEKLVNRAMVIALEVD